MSGLEIGPYFSHAPRILSILRRLQTEKYPFTTLNPDLYSQNVSDIIVRPVLCFLQYR
jgi:hypothetical protein